MTRRPGDASPEGPHAVSCLCSLPAPGEASGFCGGPVLRDARQRLHGGGGRVSPPAPPPSRGGGGRPLALPGRRRRGGIPLPRGSRLIPSALAREGDAFQKRRKTPEGRASDRCAPRPCGATTPPRLCCGVPSERSRGERIVTWLILPVVICLSQRLSHACLSINTSYCVKLRMAH